MARQGNRKTARRSSSVTRRRVLQSGAAAAALPAGLATGAQPVGPVMAALSSYMDAARERALPDEVAEKTTHHVLDTFAAMISGAHLAPGRAAIKFARGYGGERLATVVGSDVLCGPIEAALANGVLAHADETDDSHAPSLSHPGCAGCRRRSPWAKRSASTGGISCARWRSVTTSGRASPCASACRRSRAMRT